MISLDLNPEGELSFSKQHLLVNDELSLLNLSIGFTTTWYYTELTHLELESQVQDILRQNGDFTEDTIKSAVGRFNSTNQIIINRTEPD